MTGAQTPWISASGVQGLSQLRVGLKATSPYKLKTGIPIVEASDDAEEGADGKIDTGSSDLEMVQDESEQIVGLRFDRINIAAFSEIHSASIQFTAHAINEEETQLEIFAELAGSASRFEQTQRNISSRLRTTQSVQWRPVPWTKAQESSESQRTPNLASLIQEVVQHPDWQPGNSVVFIIKGKGKRVATAYSGKEGSAKLIVDADDFAIEPDPNAPRTPYRVKLTFGLPKSVGTSPRRFSITVKGDPSTLGVELDPAKSTEIVQTMERVMLADVLELNFKPETGLPILSGIEITKIHE